MEDNKYISVSELNRYLYYKFEQDILLRQVYLQGEISNFKQSGQHYYFSLKDEGSEISAMFFNPSRSSLNFLPCDGMSVQVKGKVQVYQKRGTYSIVVTEMQEIGIGLLYKQFLELKDKLAKEGLFDEAHKMPIPDYPETVGIITAATGEAINDIVSTFNRRLPLAKLILFPAIVQGAECPNDLMRALRLAYQRKDIDCLIIGRGGGSFEDLNGFNDESLARMLYGAPFPTISAVGHEGDYTICDFVCSFRAPTPTGAAMRLTKEKNDVYLNISSLSKRLVNGIKKTLVDNFNLWNNLNSNYYLAKFNDFIGQKEQLLTNFNDRLKLLTPENYAVKLNDEIDDLTHRLYLATIAQLNNYENEIISASKRLRKELIVDRITTYEDKISKLDNNLNYFLVTKTKTEEDLFNHLIEKITLLNPLNIINKGYTIVYKGDNIIYNVKELDVNDDVKIKFNDGSAIATVKNITKDE